MKLTMFSILLFTAAQAACSIQGKLGGLAAGSSPGSASTSSTPNPGNSDAPVRASGSEFLVVPDLLLMTEHEAADALAKLGHEGKLDVKRNNGCEWRDEWVDEEIAEGQICRQRTKAGKRISTRIPVSVEVAGARVGKGFMPMPNLVGTPIDEAVAFLESKGAKRIDVREGDCTDEGMVCTQSIPPRHKLTFDRTVTLRFGVEEEEY
jgi:hypothetical protein